MTGGAVERADERGLRDAFLAHGSELLSFARRSLNSRESAEDAVQETFARAWRSRDHFDATLGTLRTWLFAIERRVLYDQFAKIGRGTALSLELGAEVASADRLETAMLGWQMESALRRLPMEHRKVLVEMYFAGRTSREVARLLSIPEGTVRSRAYYALRMLRVLMEEEGWR